MSVYLNEVPAQRMLGYVSTPVAVTLPAALPLLPPRSPCRYLARPPRQIPGAVQEVRGEPCASLSVINAGTGSAQLETESSPMWFSLHFSQGMREQFSLLKPLACPGLEGAPSLWEGVGEQFSLTMPIQYCFRLFLKLTSANS